MTKRVLLAGLLGGIAMYVWTAIAHMILPLGEAGIQEIPNEQAVLAVIAIVTWAYRGTVSVSRYGPGTGCHQATETGSHESIRTETGHQSIGDSNV